MKLKKCLQILNITNKSGISYSNLKMKMNFGYKNKENSNEPHGTTVLAIKRNNKVTMIADGLMTLGSVRFKTDTIKIRKLTDKIICGFAGSVADCITLMELLESEIELHPKDLMRCCVNLAKNWRTKRAYSKVSATIIVSDGNVILNLDGYGNVIEIKDGCIGIGSGGLFAQCAAKALMDNSNISNTELVTKAMDIATDICIYSNKNYTIDELIAEETNILL